ncbi:dentin sialophosphoprotein [Spatholobus suberectus]|nr:dentin sialophosphoprotein [Spatholobus suberectus]
MDFHALSRKQLQTLCKKNKIPANITNVAMADALAALNQVEGLDEFLNPTDGDAGTPSVHHRTAGRASTQRKGAREEAEGSKVKVSTRPQRGARAAEGVVEQENKDANVPVTPAAASRRRATAVSTRRKKEVEMVVQDADNKNEVQGKPKPADVPKTPAVAPVSRTRATGRSVCTTKIETPAGTSAQRAYSTRRSVRLLEKDLSKMSLMDTDDTGLELEVCSSENNTEYECQSHDSGSDVKLVSVTENVMVVEPHGSKEDEQEKVNCLELEAEPHGSDEADIAAVSVVVSDDVSVDVTDQDVGGSFPMLAECNMDDQVSNEVDDKEDKNNDQDVNDASVSLKELVECNMDDQVSNEGDDKEDKNNVPAEEAELHDSNLILEGSYDTCDKSNDADALTEVTGQDTATLTVVVPDDVSDQEVAGWLPMSPVNDAPVNIKEFVECNIDDDQGNYMADEYYQHPLNIDEKAADESELMTDSEGILELESISHSAVKNVTIESSLPDVEAEDHKNTSENLEAEAQAAESEEPVAGEDIVLKADNGFSNVLHNTYENTSAGEDVVPQQVTVESAGSSCKFNSPVDGDVVSEDTAIPNQEPRVSSETMTEDSIHEQKSTDIPVQSVVSDQLKENVTSDELHNKSMGELKRMLKKLKLDDKSKTNVVKEVEKKRTALQVLPQNRMTAGEVQIDG